MPSTRNFRLLLQMIAKASIARLELEAGIQRKQRPPLGRSEKPPDRGLSARAPAAEPTYSPEPGRVAIRDPDGSPSPAPPRLSIEDNMTIGMACNGFQISGDVLGFRQCKERPRRTCQTCSNTPRGRSSVGECLPRASRMRSTPSLHRLNVRALMTSTGTSFASVAPLAPVYSRLAPRSPSDSL